MIGGIIPRPIAFVSTVSPDGTSLNLAPFSYYCGVASSPMTLLFCPSNKPDGTEKDTLRNARPRDEGGSGQFVVNLASEPYMRQVAAASEALDYGQSEFDLTGLATSPSVRVRPPRVAIAPIAFECETLQVIRLAPGAPSGGNIVIGRVVHAFVRDDAINERFHLDPSALQAVGRMGGQSYTRTRDRFELPMGRGALEEGSQRTA
jgi:flavin reductase (DIM6/NTAB) family NADH-FMN oxidoreductase RutF